ncbi:hypothetical protein AVEN_151196-1 [Araneus ventricosus]|uniref:Uncharacterized protein n=1 Tax=Araneus ventricosus TaxID=182803 RepID=A0A4Y2SUN2_ARAVE|nr:hypothetical protein AVEN_151196-1 [Araneus ventricosus]
MYFSISSELCEAGSKVCRNRNCYNPQKACDGVDDCGDGTDEEGCSELAVSTASFNRSIRKTFKSSATQPITRTEDNRGVLVWTFTTSSLHANTAVPRQNRSSGWRCAPKFGFSTNLDIQPLHLDSGS